MAQRDFASGTTNCRNRGNETNMNGATKIMPALIALITMTTADASAQSTTRSFYDSSGRRVGSATTSGGVATTYDAGGRVHSREYTNGNATTVYDVGGRNIGRFTTSPQR
jgi:YD repeat-containing protein